MIIFLRRQYFAKQKMYADEADDYGRETMFWMYENKTRGNGLRVLRIRGRHAE